jgi:hypothetical protein
VDSLEVESVESLVVSVELVSDEVSEVVLLELLPQAARDSVRHSASMSAKNFFISFPLFLQKIFRRAARR